MSDRLRLVQIEGGGGREGKQAADGWPGPAGVPAGSFSDWLRRAGISLQTGQDGIETPCGECKGCCRSSMFIHIRPEETQTLQRIPRALLFAAPGLPKGHLLMGYDENGRCPMLIGGKCSIYEYRPQTCRNYDCRVFAATGIPVNPQTQPEIAHRVKEWVFTYETEESRKEHSILRKAAAFLQQRRDLFPSGMLPTHRGQLAALAVRIYKVFAETIAAADHSGAAVPDAAIAGAIVSEFSEPNERSRPAAAKRQRSKCRRRKQYTNH